MSTEVRSTGVTSTEVRSTGVTSTEVTSTEVRSTEVRSTEVRLPTGHIFYLQRRICEFALTHFFVFDILIFSTSGQWHLVFPSLGRVRRIGGSDSIPWVRDVALVMQPWVMHPG